MSATAASVILRPYRPADHDACAAIYAAGRRFAFTWCDPAQFVPEDFARDSRGETITVAEEQGRVVGLLSLWMPDHFIHLLFVDPALHGRGIGRRLLRHAEATFGDWSWLKCQAQNTGALAFYEQCGWTVGEGGMNDIGPWVAVSWHAPRSRFPSGRL
ncbi:GNAT family N-acetyltransferase [uncultured Alsobacter sp.]|uniref:GNAT family N-acetyltransferase n=1 Tax=uncultured Alsobacter sp. TaxID=1748258 RepID=UPI0025DD4D4C|nr:GNAT family N-acetyltransferase [uncultured Alsobacter sp.]